MKWGDYMEKKTERVQLLVSKEELAEIKEKAKQLGVTVYLHSTMA